MSELYASGTDPYCYPGSSVLRNRFDIHDARLLADIESLYSQQRLAELYSTHPVAGRFGLTPFIAHPPVYFSGRVSLGGQDSNGSNP